MHSFHEVKQMMLLSSSKQISYVDGSDLWPAEIIDGLKLRLASNGNYLNETYSEASPTLYDSLAESEKRFIDRTAIVDDDETSYSYQEFFTLVNNFSSFLASRYKVSHGDRIGLLLYNGIEFCTAFYALNRIGAIAVPFPTKYRQSEILTLAEKADLKGMIYDADFDSWFHGPGMSKEIFLLSTSSWKGSFRDFLSATDFLTGLKGTPEDAAIIMFTSGTTSKSKGVSLTNCNSIHGILAYKKIFKITEDDITIIPVPIYHVTGLLALLGLFISCGGCVHLHKFFNAERILNDISRFGVTFLHGSPTVFSMLITHKDEYKSLPSLRIIACGSGNMPPQRIKELHYWLPQAEFRTVYGLTETSSPATVFPIDAYGSSNLGSSGIPIPGLKVKVCDEEGSLLPCNQIGTIFVKGTVVTTGYFRNTGNPLQDGWLDTGDLGYLNKEGYLFIVDRKKDMINRGGEKVCSLDVENALYEIPGIKDAAVVGIPDELYGEIPAAMIVLENGSCLNAEVIKHKLRNNLATFQIPMKYIFTDTIPETAHTKVDKKQIRRIFLHQSEGGTK